MNELDALVAKVKAHYEQSFTTWEEMNARFEDADYEESFDDTLTRKYEEGFSDSLEMILRIMKGEF